MVYVQNEHGHVLLVRNRFSKLWTLPGGFHRRGKDPRDAAIREVREETGLDISHDLHEVGQYRQSDKPHYDHIFRTDVSTTSCAEPRPQNWMSRLEIGECSWRNIRNVEHDIRLTSEALHALDLMKSVRGFEL
ncbi:NUDIX domain-containing protein [Mycolicibacterium grossiae]|uniref:NUDIX domain-containing protein n=1 Tax=Mycolicibacterium grossiae TaxID=1552759 RepID=UPI0009F37DDD|nr:NUDIX domain-containing protein [Mycolicibacterium grossiae]